MRPPSVDRLARSIAHLGLPHALSVSQARLAIAEGPPYDVERLAKELMGRLPTRVINATGTILHTNLARAPIGTSDINSPTFRASNVEFDLTSGIRGNRNRPLSELLQPLIDAELSAVVNNGASALLLVLATLAGSGSVIVSRGEMVEIGGGFRIPEVVGSSGCRLIEVGTTNRTRLADYKQALAANPGALILKVHPSNYRIEGFTEQVPVNQLAGLGVPVIYDIGSGLLDSKMPWLKAPLSALSQEPAVKQSLRDGATVVTFSGDKLLGGPQAGLIAGDAKVVGACLMHPLYRALRPGSHILELLADTLLRYLDGTATTTIPLWQMLSVDIAHLKRRAESVGLGRVVDSQALIGAGSAPGAVLNSIGVVIEGDRRSELRSQQTPIIARALGDDTLLDLRSYSPHDDHLVRRALLEMGCDKEATR